jgi:hypothetical protein
MYLLISLIAIRKRVTLNEEPCGNPFSVPKVDDRVCRILTWKVLSVKKLFMNLSTFPLKFYFCSVERTLCIHTVSYAFAISYDTIDKWFFFSNASHMLVWIIVKGSKVDRFLRKPNDMVKGSYGFLDSM